MNRCLGTKRDNSPCTVTVDPPHTYCWWHAPDNAQARKWAASRGGKRGGRGRPIAELTDTKQRLSNLADDVLEGRVEKGTGAVVSQILNVYLRAVSVEMQVREHQELAREVEELRDILEAKKGRRTWGYGTS